MNGQLISGISMLGSFFRIVDIVLVALSGVIAHFLKFDSIEISSTYLLYLLILMIFTTNIFSAFSVYDVLRGKRLLPELTRVSIAWFTVICAISTLTFLTKTGHEFSRIWVGLTVVIFYCNLVTYRIITRLLARRLVFGGFNQKSVVIVGAGKLGVRACTSMQREAWAGLFPVAFFDDKEALQGSSINNVMIQGQLADVTNYIEEQRQLNRKSVDQVWIALPLSAQEAIEGLQLALQDTATNVYFVPDLYGFNLASYDVGEVVGLPVMNMSAPLINGTTANIKRLEDIVLSAILLLVLSPVMLVCALLIKRESSGPILFKQRRYGMHGEEIIVWKFRSMTVAEDGAQVSQASRNDTRVTRVGKILRQTSLDELPQLINVLQGKMSLVGPRPHAVAHNEFYRKKVKGYMMRHQVRPGITGWAQVNGCRGETNDIADMEERVHFDLEYIRNCSIFMDLRILFLTVNTVLNTQDTY